MALLYNSSLELTFSSEPHKTPQNKLSKWRIHARVVYCCDDSVDQTVSTHTYTRLRSIDTRPTTVYRYYILRELAYRATNKRTRGSTMRLLISLSMENLVFRSSLTCDWSRSRSPPIAYQKSRSTKKEYKGIYMCFST